MQRATAIKGRLAGALSILLALPLSVCAVENLGTAGARASDRSSSRPEPAEASLGRWHDYALASITPQFSWAAKPADPAPPTVLGNYQRTLLPPSAFGPGASTGGQFSFSIARARFGESPTVGGASHLGVIDAASPGLERTVVSPTFSRRFGQAGEASVTAVLAYQRFASLGLGVTPWQDGLLPMSWYNRDTAYGAGARIDLSDAVNDRLRWHVAYQSRVDMSAFANYRGVYSDPGKFDIPASATFDLSYALSPRFSLDAGVQRVMYGAIPPFTSSALPPQFLALLNDGASPVFAWSDLNVYGAGFTVRDKTLGDLQFRYTTSQQPRPTSQLLANALAEDRADDTLSLMWTRAFGLAGRLSVVASYASSPYFLGLPMARIGSPDAGRMEFEATWVMPF